MPLRSEPRPNRRLTARLACQLAVRYGVEGIWHPAAALDVSLEGCRLRVGEDISPGTRVTVVFERPLRDGVASLTVEALGKVVWCRREGLSHQTGVHFDAEPDGLADVIAAIR